MFVNSHYPNGVGKRLSLAKGRSQGAGAAQPGLSVAPAPAWTQLTLDMFQFTLANTPPDNHSIV